MPEVSLKAMASAIARSPVVVSFPTDTVPALAARPESASLIFEAKRRPPDKPLILMGACLADLKPYIQDSEADWGQWESITNDYWPGQLTLVLPASSKVPPEMTPAMDDDVRTVGIRVPDQPLAISLLRQTGPLATTSANLSGQPPLTTAPAIAQTFPTVLVLPPEQYSAPTSGQPSTVAKWTPAGWQILRQGAVSLA